MRMPRLAALLLPLALVACKSDEKKAEDLKDEYFDEICRLYSDADCIQNQEDSCGGSLSFDSVSDCKTFLILFGGSCDYEGAIAADIDGAEACIDQVAGWDCATQPICDDQGNFAPEAGACGDLNDAIEETCETGDTGA